MPFLKVTIQVKHPSIGIDFIKGHMTKLEQVNGDIMTRINTGEGTVTSQIFQNHCESIYTFIKMAFKEG
jgi:hypothetical protein